MREFVPLVRLRGVQVSMVVGILQAPPFLQVLMVVQPFLELVVQYLGAVVPPGFFQLVESRVLYLLKY